MKPYLTAAVLAASTGAFAAEAMATEWNASVWGKRRAFTEHVEKLAELVSEKTNGEFTINVSYGGLSKPRENLDGISIGAFEIAQFCAGYHRDKNRTITVLELPFLGVNTLEEEVAVSHAVYDHPAVQDEMSQWNAKLLMT
ncbi:MAG: C4-dicarboxylate ABC transporter substrate-binding protein, partial [Marinibacterium sp.]|nr:C4-dicarboxylate ABC transporter substrate-binding protein [Marinibacterium sp.]